MNGAAEKQAVQSSDIEQAYGWLVALLHTQAPGAAISFARCGDFTVVMLATESRLASLPVEGPFAVPLDGFGGAVALGSFSLAHETDAVRKAFATRLLELVGAVKPKPLHPTFESLFGLNPPGRG